MLLLLACVSTPEEEYIINRTDGTLENVVSAKAVAPYTYETPKHWTKEIEIRGQKLHIDADIEVMNVQEFPVLTLRKDSFNAENSLTLVQNCLGNALEIREGERSYEELLYQMRIVQRGTFSEVDEETGEILFVPYEGQDEQLAALQEQLLNTPLQESYVPLTKSLWEVPMTLRRIRTMEGEYRYISCYPKTLTISAEFDGGIQKESWVIDGDAFPGEIGHPLIDVHLTQEEAMTCGNALMKSLNRTDMRIAEITKARSIDNFYNVLEEGYWITYVSSTAGAIPCDIAEYSSCAFLGFTNERMPFNERWYPEKAKLFITENGIRDLFWRDLKEVVAVANENVQLMPFSEIQQKLLSLLEFGLNGTLNNEDIYLYRIILGSSIQQIPNQRDEAFLVPTWYFFFETDDMKRFPSYAKSLLLISALDGTYINII